MNINSTINFLGPLSSGIYLLGNLISMGYWIIAVIGLVFHLVLHNVQKVAKLILFLEDIMRWWDKIYQTSGRYIIHMPISSSSSASYHCGYFLLLILWLWSLQFLQCCTIFETKIFTSCVWPRFLLSLCLVPHSICTTRYIL
jgi:hypothetical protein